MSDIQTGFVPDIISTKDAVHEEIFGAAVSPIESVGRLEIYQNQLKDTWLFQSNFLSCLTCTTATAVVWRIFEESSREIIDRLAWLYIFAQIPKVEGGTRLSDNLQFVKNSGVCGDTQCPQEAFFNRSGELDLLKISDEARADALTRAGIQYKKYLLTNAEVLMSELKEQPIMIGAYFQGSWWDEDTKSGKRYRDGTGPYGHEVLWIDNVKICGRWCRVVIDWDKKGEHSIKYLDFTHPVAQASAIVDLPGDWKTKRSMFRLVRNQDNGKVYFVNSDDRHIWVDNPQICIRLIGNRAWNDHAWADVNTAYFDTVTIDPLPFSQFFTQ